ncbi:MAG TPA: G5 domain-containing protein, partial [Bacillota bacterium]|nr:G5 domain-containing protein [Bacillota bacterium]
PLHPRDRVTPPAETVLSPKSVITIDKAFPVFIIADNSVAEIWTPVMTVHELLEEEGYSLGPYDRIEPEGLEYIYNLAEIKIVRVKKAYESEKKTVPYADVTRGNPALDRGFSRVISEGKPGLQEDLVEVTFEDGVEVSRVVVHSSLLEDPVDRIVEVGENTRLERDGRVMEFSRALMVSATAYCPGTPESGCPRNKQGHAFCTGPYNNGYTYTGKKCVQGLGTIDSPRMVAVDPRVIPLRSMLYIEGFGFARAEDIGGAIKGNRIDILFDKHKDVAQFGVKYGIKVYLLTKY